MNGIGVGASRLRASVLAVCAAAGLAACGGSGQSPVYDTTYNYLTSLAEGDYPTACAMLDSGARGALERSTGRHASCAHAFAICLPNRAVVTTQDQSQLFYATVEVSVHGNLASAALSGTAVADALRRVSLVQRQGQWVLTSSGAGLKGCPGRHARERGGGHARRHAARPRA